MAENKKPQAFEFEFKASTTAAPSFLKNSEANFKFESQSSGLRLNSTLVGPDDSIFEGKKKAQALTLE